jgi:hypothetical protein
MKLLKSTIFLAGALVAFGSLAEGVNDAPPRPSKQKSTKSRADVRAELQQAQRSGFKPPTENGYPSKAAASTETPKTRAEVKATVKSPRTGSQADNTNH